MKKSFDDLYEDLLISDSEKFNAIAEKAKKEQKICITVFLILAIIIDFFLTTRVFNFSSGVNITGLMFVLVPILVIDVFLYVIINLPFSKNRNKYNYEFKNIIIEKLLHNFYNKINYTPKLKMPRDIYCEAQYKEYFNRYYSDDYMSGFLDDTYPFKMAEVKTQEETTTTDSDGNTSTSTTTKFHGLFAKIEMNKSINSNLYIGANTLITSKQRLEMDSQEFEKHFDVSASNPIIGMQLLTHDIMELLISFRKLTGIKYDISIYNNVMYLRFHTSNMFELKSIKKGAFDKEMLKKYFDVLDFTYTLSKTIIDLIEKTEI